MSRGCLDRDGGMSEVVGEVGGAVFTMMDTLQLNTIIICIFVEEKIEKYTYPKLSNRE